MDVEQGAVFAHHRDIVRQRFAVEPAAHLRFDAAIVADDTADAVAGARQQNARDRRGRRLQAGRRLAGRPVDGIVGQPRQPRAFIGETLGDHLHRHRLAFVDDLGDARAPAALARSRGLGADRIAGAQKAVGGEADIDEGGVHRRVEAAHPAEIDAAERRRFVVAEMVDLPDRLAAHQRGAGLAGKALDQQRRAAHGRPLVLISYPRPASMAVAAATSRPTTLV